jgi:hypothetical protein
MKERRAPTTVDEGATLARIGGELSDPSQTTDVYPHDPLLAERAREQWLQGDWQSLIQIPASTLARHPERATLAALTAGAMLQVGEARAARVHARQALEWGCDRRLLGRILLAGARHTLARASFLARREQRADAHFEQALSAARMSSEIRRLAKRRRDLVQAELRAVAAAAAQLRKQGPRAAKAPAWINNLADRCLQSDDVHDSIDYALESQLFSNDERVHFLLALSSRFKAQRDSPTAMHFLHQARPFLPAADPALRNEVARALLTSGSAEAAADVVIDGALPQALHDSHDQPLMRAVQDTYQRMRRAAQAKTEHGHEVLLAHLAKHLHELRSSAHGRPLTMIEVGTTRENVPGQGSTRKLAAYCQEHGLRFVTVDMDPHNSRMARETFAALGAPFEAVTMKGEDYLRDFEGVIDLVFLDAYDFDHGKHSELRQSRYEKFLGRRIDEQACHQMHLDCAQSVARKLSRAGLVCIDDTWLSDGRWTAKGTFAMPYLLGNGFEVVEARNRAALLRRSPAVSIGATP